VCTGCSVAAAVELRSTRASKLFFFWQVATRVTVDFLNFSIGHSVVITYNIKMNWGRISQSV
jgi:hypothetical protein